MFHILGFIFFFVLIIFVIGLAILSKIIRSVFGLGRRMTGSSSSQSHSQNQRSSSSSYRSSGNDESQQSARNASDRKKIFDSDEGEYVDFEEVKES